MLQDAYDSQYEIPEDDYGYEPPIEDFDDPDGIGYVDDRDPDDDYWPDEPEPDYDNEPDSDWPEEPMDYGMFEDF